MLYVYLLDNVTLFDFVKTYHFTAIFKKSDVKTMRSYPCIQCDHPSLIDVMPCYISAHLVQPYAVMRPPLPASPGAASV